MLILKSRLSTVEPTDFGKDTMELAGFGKGRLGTVELDDFGKDRLSTVKLADFGKGTF